MRVLDPEVARERKRHVLQWVIHRYIRTSKPVSSNRIAQDGGFQLSSATIRSVLKELEQEGYLEQPHASCGRIPTDKGYRFYVDYLMGVQRLAGEEKERIQRQVQRRIAELDSLLIATSRMLSHLSHSAGFVLSPKVSEHQIQRLEVLPLGGRRYLVLLVCHSGIIRHWPIELEEPVAPERIAALSRCLNEVAAGRSIQDLQAEVLRRTEAAEREFREMSGLAREVLKAISAFSGPEDLYVDGTANILSLQQDTDWTEMRDTIRILEEKRRFARALHRQLQELTQASTGRGARRVEVRIGHENLLPELQGLSLVTTTYELGDRVAGVLGIVGPKRMEYAKMVALVDFVSSAVSQALENWEPLWGNEEYVQARTR